MALPEWYRWCCETQCPTGPGVGGIADCSIDGAEKQCWTESVVGGAADCGKDGTEKQPA